MTPPASGSNSYAPGPRQRLPVWVWGLGACACLPIAAVFALGLLAMPALRRIKEVQREAGRTKTCLSNVQQMATAMQQYTQDYDERYPPATTWMDASTPYVANGGVKDKSVFQCPTVTAAHPASFGYAFNSKLAAKPGSKVTAPALTQLLYDSSKSERNASDPVTSLPNPARHRSRGVRGMRGGGGMVNIMGYVDGHARAVSATGKGVPVHGLDTSQGPPE